jgi:hypothetical protein
MQLSRIILRQASNAYHFLGLDASGDGSIIVFLDRDARSKDGSWDLVDGRTIPTVVDPTKRLPSGRISVHVNGRVHRYAAGRRVATIYIEPIYRLSKLFPVGFLSIPRVTRLDAFDPAINNCAAVATLDIPDNEEGRINFAIEIGPQPQQPATFGVALNYELYSVVIRVIAPFMQFGSELSEHFILGTPTQGQFSSQQISATEAELAYYHTIHGKRLIIFRDGAEHILR